MNNTKPMSSQEEEILVSLLTVDEFHLRELSETIEWIELITKHRQAIYALFFTALSMVDDSEALMGGIHSIFALGYVIGQRSRD